MKVGILQSSYIPWKGYFDVVGSVDLFIFYDDVQFTNRDWRNRNWIKGKDGLLMLTVPCGSNRNRLICDVNLIDNKWQKKHWMAIAHNYAKAPFFNRYKYFFEDFYLNNIWKNLSEMNQFLIRKISKEILGFDVHFEDSRKFALVGRKGRRIIELLCKIKATEYFSGPSAKNYLDPADFMENKIKLSWMDYSDYSEYRQLFPPFEHKVSIIDLIFNEGPNAIRFLKSGRQT